MGLADAWQRLRSVAHLYAVTPCLHTDGQKQEKKAHCDSLKISQKGTIWLKHVCDVHPENIFFLPCIHDSDMMGKKHYF